MGYYSEVGVSIRFADEAGRDKVIAALGSQWGVIQEIVEVDGASLSFHEPYTKWYTEFADVRAMEELVRIARGRNDLPEDDDGFVPSSGFFARVGEEHGDVEEILWDGDVEGLPCGYALGSIETRIVFGE
jgi:hypothetical protein